MGTKEYEVAFEFPDEKEAAASKKEKPAAEEDKLKVDIEVMDDTPEEDRGRTPLPKEVLAELETDELEEYSDRARTRLKQMRKVWHDERRAKEAAFREQEEAVSMAKRALEENKRLRASLSQGEKSLVDTAKGAAELELEAAKKAFKAAYDAGDTDEMVEAQTKLNDAGFRLQQLRNYRPSLQTSEVNVNSEQQDVAVPKPDAKTLEWQDRNAWWGTDPEMTALALGYHQKLERQFGKQYVGTDEYWQNIDKTMRRRFPDYFGEEEETPSGGGKPAQRAESKPATVVAPASRSTSSKRVVLKQSELALAKKFGLTPEQYAKEKMRLENQNG